MSNLIRIDFVLIPSDSQFVSVIEASQAITKSYKNMNIIDAVQFPPHISLHICTIPQEKLNELKQLFDNLEKERNLKPVLRPIQLVKGSSGYVSLDVEITYELRELHKAVINIAASLREGLVEDEPRWLQKYDEEDRKNFHKYGNIYVLDRFSAHFSIAKVESDDQSAAFEIARSILDLVGEEQSAEFHIVDIGMWSEKWDVLSK